MSLRLTEVETIPGGINNHPDGKWTRLVKEFLESGYKAARIDTDLELETPADMEKARVAMHVAAKKNALPVKVCRREGKLYLVREE